MQKMKIGVLGTGDVGKVLAAGLAAAGHEVMIGTRDPSADALSHWRAEQDLSVQAGSFDEAAAFGEVVILAVGWDHAKAVIDLIDPKHVAGKVVLDPTNPLRFEQEGQPPVLTLGHTDSAGEQVQRWWPGARVVKWMNIVGNPHMVDPDLGGDKPDLFICGNDTAAKVTANALTEQLGWPPVIDLGNIDKSRYLEPMAMVWITHFFNTGFKGDFAFKLLRA